MALALTLVGAELLLRFALFGQGDIAARMGRRLRHEGLFAAPESGDGFKLQWLFHRDEALVAPGPDALLGWSGPVTPGTYTHRDEPSVGAQRPVLLYGDSNAQCMTLAEDCFQGLLERSDLGATHELVNFGVGGYGLDQTYLMLRSTVDRFTDRKPIVVVSILLDDDLARSLLDFRCWPKPRFRLVGGRLVEPEPLVTEPGQFLADHPPEVTSYLARLLAHKIAPAEAVDLTELRALNRALLEAIHAELERRDLEYFFYLFSFDRSIRGTRVAQASRAVVTEFLSDHAIPYVDLVEFVRAICDPQWRCLDELIGRNDPVLMGHYNDAGNRLAFEALRQGLEGRFGAFDFERVRRLAAEGLFHPDPERSPPRPLLGFLARCVVRSTTSCSRWDETVARGPLPRLALRAPDDTGTRLDVELLGAAHSARARVSAVRHASTPAEAAQQPALLRFVARTDGERGAIEEFRAGDAPRTITWSLTGTQQLSWLLTATGADSASTWLVLEDLTIE